MKENLLQVAEDKQWRMEEKVELQNDVNSVTFIKLQSLRLMGLLETMDDASNKKKNTKPIYTKKRPKSRPKARWKDDV
jgi:hypothetical protein